MTGPKRGTGPWVAGLFLATRALALWLPPHVSDIPYYASVSDRLAAGEMPYRDFVLEYPPLVVPFLILPQLGAPLAPADPLRGYRLVFGLEMLLLDALAAALVYRQACRAGRPLVPLTYVAATALLGPLLLARLDIAVGLCCLFALTPASSSGALFRRGLALGAGILLKLVPVLLVPLILFEYGAGRRRRPGGAAAFAAGSLLVPALVFGALALWLGTFDLDFIAYHRQRGIQIESTWGNLALLAQAAGVATRAPLAVEHSFGAQHLSGGITPLLLPLALPASVVVLLLGYALVWRSRGRRDSLFLAGTVLLAGAMLTNKVFSPQFLLWILPTASLAFAEFEPGARRWLYAGLMAVVVATLAVFVGYWNLVEFRPLQVMLLSLRNGLLALIWSATLLSLVQPGRS